jgi:simple sugar transport system ATP-binding protein
MTKRQLARLMVGREVLESLDREAVEPGEVVLRLEQVDAAGDRGVRALRGLSMDVRAGEIVGVAGVAGNGQTELAEVITGLRPCTGRILVNGRDVANRSAIASISAGVAHVPEDRQGTGSAPNLSLIDNLIMKTYRRAPIGGGWTIDYALARRRARELKDAYEVVAPSLETHARLLSGGNVQRLILAREMSSEPTLVVAVQPTRGLDVGAIESVHRLLLARRAAGAAILLISEDLDEILLLADRVAVMYEGRIVGESSAAEADVHTLGMLMTGDRETVRTARDAALSTIDQR